MPSGYGFNNTLLAAFYVTPNVAGVDFYTADGQPWNVSNSTGGCGQFGLHYGGGRTDYVQVSMPVDSVAPPGTNVAVNGTSGGSSQVGGSTATFSDVASAGTFNSIYYTPVSSSGLASDVGSAAAGSATFLVPGSTDQVWDLGFDGSFTGSTTVVLHFDPSLLGGVNPASLVIYHWDGSEWTVPPGQVVDPVADTITFTTDSFSPFMLGEVPEPGTLVLLGSGALSLAGRVLRKRRAFRFSRRCETPPPCFGSLDKQPAAIVSRVVSLAVLMGLLLWTAGRASAAVTYFTNVAGDWTTSSNWSNGVPTSSAGVSAYIGGSGTAGYPGYTANLTESGSAEKLYVGTGSADPSIYQGAGTLNMSGSAQLYVPGGLFAGYETSGTINITGGTLTTGGTSYIGLSYNSGGYNSSGTASGAVAVSGSGAAWTTSGDVIHVGYYGPGTLSITNGGAVSDTTAYIGDAEGGASGAGYVTVDGTGSKWTNSSALEVGFEAGGTLAVTNGAAVSAGQSYLGVTSGSAGTLNLDGAGTSAHLGGFIAGRLGTGTLSVTNGAMLTTAGSGLGGVGADNGSLTAHVDGSGSTWNCSSISMTGTSNLYVSGGGTVNATNGVTLGSGATLEVDAGCGSSVAVASSLTNSGTVRVVAGADAASTGTVTPLSLAGSVWPGNGTVQAVGGTWNWSTGTFTVSNVVGGTLGTATPIDTSVNQRVLWTGGGEYTLGASFLATTSSNVIAPTVTALSGTSLPELSPNQAVIADWGLSGVTASSANPVYLSLIGGYPSDGYPVGSPTLWYSSNNGTTWSQVAGANAADLTFDGTSYSFVLTGSGGAGLGFDGYDYAVVGTPLLPGDVNLDGRVDVNDLTIVLNNFGDTGCTWTQGCMNGDPTGTVDINDLTIVIAFMGQTAASSGPASVGVVPEPSSLMLVGAILAGLLICIRRRAI